MAAFKAFKPSGMEKIARSMGYKGNMKGFNNYLSKNPSLQKRMQGYTDRAVNMARGGLVFNGGGDVASSGGSDDGSSRTAAQIAAAQAAQQKQQDAQQAANTGASTITSAGTGVQQGIQPIVTKNYNAADLGQANPSVKKEKKPYVPPVIEGLVYEGFGEGKQRGGFGGGTGYKMPETGYTPAQMETFRQMQGSASDGIYSNAEADMYSLKNKNEANERIKLGTQEAYLINQYKASKGNGSVDRQDYADYMGRYGFSVDSRTPPEGITYRPEMKVMGPIVQQQTQQFLDNNPDYFNRGTQAPQTSQPIAADPLSQAPVPTQNIQPLPDGSAPTIGDVTTQRMQNPGLPIGAATTAAGIVDDPSQNVAANVGQVAGSVAAPIAGATTSYAQAPIQTDANLAEVGQTAPAVDAALTGLEAAQGTVSEASGVVSAQQEETSVSSLSAAQGDAILMDNPVQREIQAGELITGAADAQKAAQYTEQVQAATATPTQKATVQGQLKSLMADFEGGETPAWAAGAMRAATAAMVARGLGASSLAGQAIIQATMEAALPIAQADASTQAQFESQNLSNRQQRAMLAAEQRAKFMGQEFDQDFQARVQNAGRIADIANMNFTAEQQVALENSRNANTMNLNNLSNRQGMVMAEAAALSQMDSANLSNRQQAAVINAQNFMQMDMTNLSNRQQTDLFKGQARTQSILTDQAARNAASQFNASSQNQVDQFFSNLANNVSQFNANQANGQAQFNAGETNTMEKFNSEINNQRDQFNAQNQMVIAQSNATWRRQIATADTAAINRANEVNAQNVLAISNQAYAALWQQYGDTMEWAWTSAENAQDRISALAIADLDASARLTVAQEAASSASGEAIGSLIGTLGSAWITKG